MKNRIVVFASGSGTNFISIYNNIKNQNINGEIVLLISDKAKCGAIDFAEKNNIEVCVIQNKTFIKKVDYDVFLLSKINSKNADFTRL